MVTDVTFAPNYGRLSNEGKLAFRRFRPVRRIANIGLKIRESADQAVVAGQWSLVHQYLTD